MRSSALRRRGLLAVVAVIAALCAAQSAQAENYALPIGIDDYQFPGLRDLHYAESDALLMRDALVSHAGFPPENVRILVGQQATRRAIASEMKGWLRSSASPADTVLFYFAGHGVQLIDDNGDEEDGYDECLWAWDSALLDITLIRDDDLNRWLSGIDAARKIAVLDCCHSGTASRHLGGNALRVADVDRDSIRLSSRETRAEIERSFDAGLGLPDGASEALLDVGDLSASGVGGVVELAGCQPDQVVVEAPQLEHGALTYFLAEGIRGIADSDLDGLLTLAELRQYAARRIREFGFAQDPMLSGPNVSFALNVGGEAVAQAPSSVADPGEPQVRIGVAAEPATSLRVLVKSDTPSEAARAISALSLPEAVFTGAKPLDRIVRVRYDASADRTTLEISDPMSGTCELAMSFQSDELASAIDAVSEHLAAAAASKALAAVRNTTTPVRIGLDGPAIVAIGESLSFRVTPNADGRLFVVNLSSDGSLFVLYPNRLDEDNRVRRGETVSIPAGGWRIEAAGPPGVERVKAVLTTSDREIASLIGDVEGEDDPYALSA
ncbi:DUF4384 domain-containing protein [Candidatus Poribacteria bacterium]|nr:DUF4384 domain-containing protein [Candidatus Poribacteria bacterium]